MQLSPRALHGLFMDLLARLTDLAKQTAKSNAFVDNQFAVLIESINQTVSPLFAALSEPGHVDGDLSNRMIDLIQKYRALRAKAQEQEKQLRSVLEMVVQRGYQQYGAEAPPAGMFNDLDFGQALQNVAQYALKLNSGLVAQDGGSDQGLGVFDFLRTAGRFGRVDGATQTFMDRDLELQQKERDAEQVQTDTAAWKALAESQWQQIQQLEGMLREQRVGVSCARNIAENTAFAKPGNQQSFTQIGLEENQQEARAQLNGKAAFVAFDDLDLIMKTQHSGDEAPFLNKNAAQMQTHANQKLCNNQIYQAVDFQHQRDDELRQCADTDDVCGGIGEQPVLVQRSKADHAESEKTSQNDYIQDDIQSFDVPVVQARLQRHEFALSGTNCQADQQSQSQISDQRLQRPEALEIEQVDHSMPQEPHCLVISKRKLLDQPFTAKTKTSLTQINSEAHAKASSNESKRDPSISEAMEDVSSAFDTQKNDFLEMQTIANEMREKTAQMTAQRVRRLQEQLQAANEQIRSVLEQNGALQQRDNESGAKIRDLQGQISVYAAKCDDLERLIADFEKQKRESSALAQQLQIQTEKAAQAAQEANQVRIEHSKMKAELLREKSDKLKFQTEVQRLQEQAVIAHKRAQELQTGYDALLQQINTDRSNNDEVQQRNQCLLAQNAQQQDQLLESERRLRIATEALQRNEDQLSVLQQRYEAANTALERSRSDLSESAAEQAKTVSHVFENMQTMRAQMQTLCDALEQSRFEFARLTLAFSGAGKQIQSMYQRVHGLESAIGDYGARMELLLAENHAMRQQNSKLNDIMHNQEERLQQALLSAQESKLKSDEGASRLHEALSNAQDARTALERQNAALAEEFKKVQEQQRDAEHKLREQLNSSGSLVKEQFLELEALKQQTQDRNSQYQRQIAEQQTKIAELSQKIAQYAGIQRETGALAEQNAKLVAECQQLVKSCGDKEQQIASLLQLSETLQNEHEAMQVQTASLKGQNAELASSVEELQQKIENLTQANQEASASALEQKSMLVEAQRVGSAKNKKIEQLASEKQLLQGQVASLRQSQQELQQELQLSQCAASELMASQLCAEEFKSQLSQSEGEAQRLRQELEALAKSSEAQKSEISTLRAENADIQAKAARASQDLNQISSKTAERTAALANQVESLKKAVADSERRENEARDELRRVMQKTARKSESGAKKPGSTALATSKTPKIKPVHLASNGHHIELQVQDDCQFFTLKNLLQQKQGKRDCYVAFELDGAELQNDYLVRDANTSAKHPIDYAFRAYSLNDGKIPVAVEYLNYSQKQNEVYYVRQETTALEFVQFLARVENFSEIRSISADKYFELVITKNVQDNVDEKYDLDWPILEFPGFAKSQVLRLKTDCLCQNIREWHADAQGRIVSSRENAEKTQ